MYKECACFLRSVLSLFPRVIAKYTLFYFRVILNLSPVLHELKLSSDILDGFRSTGVQHERSGICESVFDTLRIYYGRHCIPEQNGHAWITSIFESHARTHSSGILFVYFTKSSFYCICNVLSRNLPHWVVPHSFADTLELVACLWLLLCYRILKQVYENARDTSIDHRCCQERL